jgi:hypothetical protein
MRDSMFDIESRKSLLKYLDRAELGPLHVGMDQADVSRLLGQPEWVDNPPYPELGPLWGYGNLELGISAELTVDHIYIVFGRPSYGMPSALQINWYDAIKTWTIEYWLRFLKQHSCACTEKLLGELSLVDPSRIFIIGDAPIVMGFSPNNRGKLRIDKMGYSIFHIFTDNSTKPCW